jgi:outer membrane protein assembly factor BamB
MSEHRSERGPAPRREFKINLGEAIDLGLPATPNPLERVRYGAADGREGWMLKLPESRPIATPAYDDGVLFFGGGYGAYEFYAIDARTAELLWKITTADDGPTAAVVSDGHVAFNTESCTVMVCEAKSGRVVWEEWLGDPLMGQPAIAGDRLFIAYPADQAKPLLRPNMSLDEKREAIREAKLNSTRGKMHHRLLCTELRTGQHLWEQEITGDVITAPVVEGPQVFLTCYDGTSFCLNVEDGAVIWKRHDRGTAAPLVVGDEVRGSEKVRSPGGIFQKSSRRRRTSGEERPDVNPKLHRSPYLMKQREGGSSLRGAMAMKLDGSVGFSSKPSSAKLEAAEEHIGVGRVASAWAYQGSRSAYAKGRIFTNEGSRVSSVRDGEDRSDWEAEAAGAGVDMDDQIFLPPALGREFVYLTSLYGHAVSLHQERGDVDLLYKTGRGISFQPCLAQGRMYFGTAQGELVCIETGSDDADGWYMWGGNAQHNKVQHAHQED